MSSFVDDRPIPIGIFVIEKHVDLQVNMCVGQPGNSKPGFLKVRTSKLPLVFIPKPYNICNTFGPLQPEGSAGLLIRPGRFDSFMVLHLCRFIATL